jgi:hypothetical protein
LFCWFNALFQSCGWFVRVNAVSSVSRSGLSFDGLAAGECRFLGGCLRIG